MHEEIFISVGLILGIFCVTLNMVIGITKCVKDAVLFINSVDENLKASHLKSDYFRVLKYQIIKNLESMKGMIRLSVITLVLLVMTLMFVSCKSTEKQKLEAQKIEYVSQIIELQVKLDSLNTIFDKVSVRLDSITNHAIELGKIAEDLKKDNDSLKQSNKNLNNVIKHQNQMINDLKKKK